MCHKTPPQIGSTGDMSPGIPKDPWGNMAPWQNPFDQLAQAKASQVVAPSKATHITVTPVSNGFVIKVSKNSTTIERIVPDFENIGDEIMTALAEIQLGK